MADVRVTLNRAAALQRLSERHRTAQFAMSEQALKDCNYYCKQDQDGLINSSITHSDFENGTLKWKTPYARRQYYLDSACRDKNPYARKMWAHEAGSQHKEDWRLIYERLFNGGR